MPTTSPRRPGRPRAGSEDKHARILREAVTLFAEKGFAATSLGDVAAASDISKAGLLHHFGSKEGLYGAVLEHRDDVDFVGMTDVGDDVWAYLHQWVGLMAANARTPEMVRLYSAMAVDGVEADHPAHPWLHQHFLRTVQATAEAFERGKAAGVVHPDAPSRELARTVVAVSDGVQLQWLCARADAAAAGEEVTATPEHAGVPLDMAAQMRVVVELIEARWRSA
ncbi:TetR/AcrR family transcriptional regulator [Isoptericola aurantiacus]|uniref:TetR/AcrR family transcriptional regulator n=1 Tax=Isoptericola aurantiacus TaxID=3377839 RepID=UPI00383B7BFA